MTERDVWDEAAGLGRPARGDRIREYEKKKQNEAIAKEQAIMQKIREREAIMRQQNSLRSRTKRGLTKTKNFFVGPNGILRRDLLSPIKRKRR